MSDSAASTGAPDLGDIVEDEKPSIGLEPPKSFDLPAHNAKTRRYLAFSILGVIAILDFGAGAAYLFGGVPVDDLVKFMAAFSGLQTLAAAVFGFYFAKDS